MRCIKIYTPQSSLVTVGANIYSVVKIWMPSGRDTILCVHYNDTHNSLTYMQ